MSWNTCIVLAKDKTLEDLEHAIIDVYQVTEEEVDWETASSSSIHPSMALGEHQGWAVIYTPSDHAATYPDMLEKLSEDGLAFVGMTFGHSDYHGFLCYRNGKHERTLIRERRKVAVEEGAPLPEEASLDWSDEEEAVFVLAERLTGLKPSSIRTWGEVRFKLAVL